MDALLAMEASRPGVILLDLCMPHVDGFDLLQQIRADRRWDGVVVLMFSAVVGLDVRLQAMELGAQGYVDKGTPFEEIRAEVELHLAAR